jgi:hypothetical protein
MNRLLLLELLTALVVFAMIGLVIPFFMGS